MRGEYSPPASSVLTWLLCALAGGFLVQVVANRIGYSAEELAALSPAALRHGRIWTLFSYVFLHESVWHLLFNGLGVFLLGREILPLLGHRQFLVLVGGTVLLAGLTWVAVHAFSGGREHVGATALVFSFLAVFACLVPDREVTFLLFFVLPVRVQPRLFAWLVALVAAVGCAVIELPGATTMPEIAFSSHLSGMAAGWAFYRFVFARFGWDRTASVTLELPRWLRRRPMGATLSPAPVEPGAPPENLREEVDRILDKINSDGFGALTPSERQTLDQAKDTLSRR